MNTLMPNTVSVSDIQKNYRKVFDRVKRTKEPVIVLSNNKPDVAIIGYDELETLRKVAHEVEVKDALAAIADGDRELQTGKTKTASTLAELLK